jgi:hypothetical protein
MFWSSNDRDQAEAAFSQAGLTIVESTAQHIVEDEDEGDVLCVLASRQGHHP